ncbi:MAG: hypothetical protein ACR2GN_03480 [Bacteroidia bacterium]
MKNFTICLSVMIAFMLSVPAMAQNNAKIISAGSESEYVSNGPNYQLKLEQSGNDFTVDVMDPSGNVLNDAKNITGVMGVAYLDGTAEQFDLTSKGKNKVGITVPAGKTVTDVRMMVEVEGERNITGFNLATGKTHSGSNQHSDQ